VTTLSQKQVLHYNQHLLKHYAWLAVQKSDAIRQEEVAAYLQIHKSIQKKEGIWAKMTSQERNEILDAYYDEREQYEGMLKTEEW